VSAKKYLVCPGPMQSKEDGDEKHHVTSDQLIHLYKVDPKDCHIYVDGKDKFRSFPKDMLLLIPRYEREDYVAEKCFTVGQMIAAGIVKAM